MGCYILKDMFRVVLDTSIVVAGLRSRRGASNIILAGIARRRVIPLMSTPLLLEYEAVLKRPEQQLATGLNPAQVERFLAALASAAHGVDTHFRWRPQLRDPADELVLEAAVNGRADALLTHNVRDFSSAAERFGLRLLSPGQFLQEYPL